MSILDTIRAYSPKYELKGPQPRMRLGGLWLDITPEQAEILRQALAEEARKEPEA
jgi:hypothetical protein